MKLKIAIYSGEIPSTTFIERLIRGLETLNCEIFLFGYLKNVPQYSSNIKIKGYPDNRLIKFFIYLKYSFLLFFFKSKEKKKLDKMIAKKYGNTLITKIKYYPVLYHKPAVFHLQWAKGVEDWIWVQDFGMKLIVSLRGAHINYSPLFDVKLANSYKTIFPRIDGFHAVSNAIANEAQKYGAKKEKIQVVYSGLKEVNVSIHQPKIKNDVFKIISIGRNHWKKGYDYSIRTASLLKELEIDFSYQIIGASDSEELRYLIATNQLQNNVILSGALPFIEVQNLIQTADLLLLPSVEEGIANVVLEAMQLGTLVLTTDCGGMDEVVINGTNGFIVPIRNPKKMADVILEIMQLSEDDKNSIIKAAKITIENKHTESKMIHDMFTFYQNVLKS